MKRSQVRTEFSRSEDYVFTRSFDEKVKITDEIFLKQPNLLTAVVMLSKLGVSEEHNDRVLTVLLVLYDYFQGRGKPALPEATEKMLEKAYANTGAMLRLIQKEGPDTGWALLKKGANKHPESEALFFSMRYLSENGITGKNKGESDCGVVALALVECFAKVKQMQSKRENRSMSGGEI